MFEKQEHLDRSAEEWQTCQMTHKRREEIYKEAQQHWMPKFSNRFKAEIPMIRGDLRSIYDMTVLKCLDEWHIHSNKAFIHYLSEYLEYAYSDYFKDKNRRANIVYTNYINDLTEDYTYDKYN